MEFFRQGGVMLRRFFNWRNWRGRFVYCLTFIVIGLHCGAISESLAATAVVKWDRSPSSDVAGYVVYYGTQQRQYEYEEDCGDILECKLFSLDDQTTYYIAVRAYDWSGQMSDYSDEVEFISASGSEVVVVDNSDSAFSTVGTWSHSSTIPGYYGVDYQYHAPGAGNKTANWAFEISSNGVYEISVRWSSHANRAPDATYSIFNNGTYLGDETVDQTVNGGQFIPIGEYSLLPGQLEVILTDEASGYVIADAVKLELDYEL
jgi:hypothetical protein